MDEQLSSPQVTWPIIPIGLQQQWKGAQDRFHSCFSQCINSVHRKFQGRGLDPSTCEGVRGLRLPFFKPGLNPASANPTRGEVWATEMKKAWENVGVQVGQALQEGKNKLAVSLTFSQGNAMLACSSLARNLCNKHSEQGHLFDIAMSTEEVAKRLEGIPVYTVSNSANEFVLISDMNNERSLGLFCFRPQDAEALLSQVVTDKEPGLGRGGKVVAVSLNKVYELHIEGIAFRFLPDPHQVMNALEAKAKTNAEDPRPSFAGVPVFQSDNLILRSKNKRFRPIFFNKEDLDLSLERAFEQQRKLNPSLQISTALQVGSFEDVIKRMEQGSKESSSWTDIVFIPPGLDIFNHIGKPDPAQGSSNGSAFG